MRAWLALKLTSVEFKLHDVGIFTRPGWRDRILAFSGAGKVPILVDGSLSIHESLAICELLAERYPEAQLWPDDAALRARARAVSCEMLSGFSELRSRMPCNLRGRASKCPSGEVLDAEIARVLEIWEASLSSSEGEFLFGEFGVADCMYMPVASRFRTYGVPLPARADAYCDAVFGHPIVRELLRVAQTSESISQYDALLQND
jgi:glutathione S-transferase